jgi:cystathionine beta-lyase
MIADDTNRRVVSNHLLNDNGYYRIDWDDFEKKCAVPTNRAFILCSPANPIGRVWTPEELKRMADICRRNQVLFIADEIHSDIIRQGISHTPIIKAADDLSNIILIIGINKSFNVAGLHCSNTVIPDKNLREIFNKQFGMRMPTPFAMAAVMAAYEESEDWLDELNLYLDGNIDLTLDFFHKNMPKVKVWRPEGTYMLWLDFGAYGLSGDEVHRKIYVDANVMLQDGLGHDPEEGTQFQRMCVALSRPMLEKALKRIAAAF